MHKWSFFRYGGFDQVLLATGGDLLHLGELDQKLWSALACPVRGLEFDSRTLELLDTDQDGYIRAPEILAAVRWACSALKDPGELIKGGESLPLSAMNESTPEGREVLASARQILKNLGKEDAGAITAEDTQDTEKIFAKTRFNGDGVIPPEAAPNEALAAAVTDIMACVGSEKDRNGSQGVSQALVERFFEEAQAFSGWWAQAEADAGRVLPLGPDTALAFASFTAVRPKVDDFFTRCRLAGFDARAAGFLNRSEADYAALAAGMLSESSEAVAAFPMARVQPGACLPLAEGLNPAWAGPMAAFRTLAVLPFLGEKDALTEKEWSALKERFAPHEEWLKKKAGTSVENLGLARVRQLMEENARETVLDLIAQDKALEPESNAIAQVDRLVRYHRDLYALLNNFISFWDFYTRKHKAVFQAGTLYMDGRSCDLCVRADDAARHAALAGSSRIFLAYCECTRKGSAEKMTIAAAFTDGDADRLTAGRNGVFYDRLGRDWNATIVRLVEHPISIRQAFWAPYRRIGKMIGQQVEKFASSREKAVEEKAAQKTAEAGQSMEGAKPGASPAFDVGRFAGIFAAIGLAVGSIGMAAASAVSGFFGLRWWQMPLAVVGLILVVSGPSMVIAWLKMRRRNLGPLLDANGWAVNTRASINIPFGRSLTSVARLPAGAEQSLTDPYAARKTPWVFAAILTALLLLTLALWGSGFLSWRPGP